MWTIRYAHQPTATATTTGRSGSCDAGRTAAIAVAKTMPAAPTPILTGFHASAVMVLPRVVYAGAMLAR
jgi:hypothetical protein